MWQCGTIQLDFSMSERLGASYIGKSGQKETPVMIHRAIFCSVERFIGILIEHYGGRFPLWLAPEQVVIIPVSEKHHEFVKSLYSKFSQNRIRVNLDHRNEKVGYKIRDNELKKASYMLIVGDKEVESGKVSVRQEKEGDLGLMSVQDFQNQIVDKIRRRQ